jgi:hypothetical protein
MATSPNFSWPEPDNTDLVKNGALAIRTAVNAIDASLYELKGGTTGQVLSKTSNTDMDFTWVAQDDSNAIQNAIVDAKGDLIGATAADTPARLAVGTNGQVLTADSTAATGLAWATASAGSSYVAGKNAFLNSALNVWQRGTSSAVTSSSTSFMVADRWNAYRGATGSTFSRQATSDTTNLPFIQYCARFQRDAANTSTANLNLIQNIETINSIPYAGKAVTLSFYARAGANYSATSNALLVFLRNGTGTDQNFLVGYTGVNDVVSSSATLTTTWQRFTFTGTVPTNSTELAIQIQANPTGTAGANDYFEFTGAQLEIASSASAYSPNAATYALELAACQRYYYRVNNESGTGSLLAGFGSCDGTTIADILVPFPATMRVSPTSLDQAQARIYNLSNGTNYSGGTWTLAGGNAFFGGARYTHGSGVFTSGSGVKATSSGSGSAYLGFSAEL